MKNKVIKRKVFIITFVLIVLCWFIMIGYKAHLTEGNQILLPEEDYFDCSEGWYDDEGNTFNIEDISFDEDDIQKEFEFHYLIPADLYLDDNYSICFFSRALDMEAYMLATEESVYDDPETYGQQYFYEYEQNGAGLSGNDIGVVVHTIPIYWTDSGNEVTLILKPTEVTAFIYDIRIQDTSVYNYSILRERWGKFLASIIVLAFGIVSIFYTLFTPGIEKNKKSSYYARDMFGIIAGILLLNETQVLQILTGKPELLTAIRYLLVLIASFPLAVFIDEMSAVPHRHFAQSVGIIVLLLILFELVANLFFKLPFYRTVILTLLLALFDYFMAFYLMIKDAIYCNSHFDATPTFPSYMAVIFLLSCNLADLIIYLVNDGHLVDCGRISRIGYVVFIILLLCRLMQLSIGRDHKAMLAEMYKAEARTDAMTGLLNKGAFLEREMDLTGKLWVARRNQNEKFKFVIMSIDLNNLKVVNDTRGHAIGDKYIVSAATIMKNAVGNEGEIYRVGGDEFMVLIFGNDPERTYEHIVGSLISGVKSYNEDSSNDIQLSLAYGHALCTALKSISIYDVEKEADNEMYECKKAMKNS